MESFQRGPTGLGLSLHGLPRLPGSPGHCSAAPSSTDSCSLASSLQEGMLHFICGGREEEKRRKEKKNREGWGTRSQRVGERRHRWRRRAARHSQRGGGEESSWTPGNGRQGKGGERGWETGYKRHTVGREGHGKRLRQREREREARSGLRDTKRQREGRKGGRRQRRKITQKRKKGHVEERQSL